MSVMKKNGIDMVEYQRIEKELKKKVKFPFQLKNVKGIIYIDAPLLGSSWRFSSDYQRYEVKMAEMPKILESMYRKDSIEFIKTKLTNRMNTLWQKLGYLMIRNNSFGLDPEVAEGSEKLVKFCKEVAILKIELDSERIFWKFLKMEPEVKAFLNR